MDLPNLRDSGLEFSDRGEVEQVRVVQKDRAEVGGAPQLALHQLVQRTRLGRHKPVKIIKFPSTYDSERSNVNGQGTNTEKTRSAFSNLSLYLKNILRFLKIHVFVDFHNNFTYRHLHVLIKRK